MKLLCTADLHRSEALAQKVLDTIDAEKIDVLINCGDFLSNDFAANFFRRLKVRSFIVPGNWDPGLKSIEKNVTVLNHGIKEYNGYYFLASSSGFPSDSEAMIDGTKEIDAKKIIFMTHYPPEGVLDRAWSSRAGYAGYRQFDEAKKPLAHVFGHIHEDNGHIMHNDTMYINCALALIPQAYVFDTEKVSVKPIVMGEIK